MVLGSGTRAQIAIGARNAKKVKSPTSHTNQHVYAKSFAMHSGKQNKIKIYFLLTIYTLSQCKKTRNKKNIQQLGFAGGHPPNY